jgi:flagellar hook protein FlgE
MTAILCVHASITHTSSAPDAMRVRTIVAPHRTAADTTTMSSVAAPAHSGMNAALTLLSSSAHNVANLPTEGFRRQTVSLREAANGGVTAQVDRAPVAGEALERDVVDQLRAKHAFLANLTVFRTSDEMTGSLLDLEA